MNCRPLKPVAPARLARNAAISLLLVVSCLGWAPLTRAASTSSSSGATRFLVHPYYHLYRKAGAPLALPSPSVCESGALGDSFACYGPSQIRAAYNVPANLDGTGQTIVIVDAFGSATIRNDLHVFDQEFGLPDPKLNIYYPGGYPNTGIGNYLGQFNWAIETSLDVEWSHAIAPGATIDLVVGRDDSFTSLNQAERFAANNHLGNVMSMSYGVAESLIAPDAATFFSNPTVAAETVSFQTAVANKMTLLASAGDDGATDRTAAPVANYSSSRPEVTSVGGTDLFVNDSGQRTAAVQQNGVNEEVWNETDNAPTFSGGPCTIGGGATGGAPSLFFNAPTYQTGLTSWASYQTANGNTTPTRTTADVSYNAGVCTGVWVIASALVPFAGSVWIVGGTSAGSPQWAGIVALANQARASAGKGPIGALNPLLYGIAATSGTANDRYATDFYDITVGDNNLSGLGGFTAAVGYDNPTGIGSPNVANLLTDLVAAP
jgi:subtilase family serine protease